MGSVAVGYSAPVVRGEGVPGSRAGRVLTVTHHAMFVE